MAGGGSGDFLAGFWRPLGPCWTRLDSTRAGALGSRRWPISAAPTQRGGQEGRDRGRGCGAAQGTECGGIAAGQTRLGRWREGHLMSGVGMGEGEGEGVGGCGRRCGRKVWARVRARGWA